MKPLPVVPGVKDLAALLMHLEAVERRKKWLDDAREVVKENQAAVRLLGATEKIEQDLRLAERDRQRATAAVDAAHAQARSIVDEAVSDLDKRKADLEAREKTFNETKAAGEADLRKRVDEFDIESQAMTGRLRVLEAALKGKSSDLTEREDAIVGREKRVERLDVQAKSAKAEAEALTERMGAAMAKPAQPAA